MTDKMKKELSSVKEKYPGTLILFNRGVCFTIHKEDAEACAKALGIMNTRDREGDMQASFPCQELDTYLPKLIRAGYRVCIVKPS